jgi:hypothetical protein
MTPDPQILVGLLIGGLALLFLLVVVGLAIAAAWRTFARRSPRQPCAPDAWVVDEIDNRLTRHRQRREVDALLRELYAETPPDPDEDSDE